MKTWMMVSLALMMVGCSGARPARLGVTEGKLLPCPSSPNCVCSQATDGRHAIAPFPYEGSPGEARSQLLSVLKTLKHAKVVTDGERYLHVEFTSGIFHFVDDVEFLIAESPKAIHVRSASRVGYYDFGVNRKRVETIRKLFTGAT